MLIKLMKMIFGGDSEKTPLPMALKVILYGLRLALGWLFFYEGVAKLLIPDWTSAPYLITSRGIGSSFFHWLASSPPILHTVDQLNIWGLILVGSALMLGLFTRFASACGISLLGLYYLAQPPLLHTMSRIPSDGHYLIFDKAVIMMLVLIIFLFIPSGKLWGFDRLIQLTPLWRRLTGPSSSGMADVHSGDASAKEESQEKPKGGLTRREALENLAAIPFAGVMGYAASEKYAWEKVHSVTGATIKLSNLTMTDLKGRVPHGKIGKLSVSRLILGGNLIGGGAHSRDLLYVPQLFRAYNTGEKIIETLELCERTGVNTVLLSSGQLPLLNKYREMNYSKMQAICQVYPEDLYKFLHYPTLDPKVVTDIRKDIDQAVSQNADLIYINGAVAERFVKLGRFDILHEFLERIKSHGYQAGLGGHSVEVPIQCDACGLDPDFYVKTLHSDKYWSAHPRENRVEFSVDSVPSLDHNQFHDNIFDLFPEKTIDTMHKIKRPWIAFKVLAAGAIRPEEGFRFAFENGADFICVGMLDFQVIEDANAVVDILGSVKNRVRPWYA